MSEEEIIEMLDNYFQQNDNEGRLERVQSVKRFTEYSMRITELSDNERKDFYLTMEGGNVSDAMRKTLSECKNEKQKNYYLDMWARATYFKKCAWLTYLHEGGDKPFVA